MPRDDAARWILAHWTEKRLKYFRLRNSRQAGQILSLTKITITNQYLVAKNRADPNPTQIDFDPVNCVASKPTNQHSRKWGLDWTGLGFMLGLHTAIMQIPSVFSRPPNQDAHPRRIIQFSNWRTAAVRPPRLELSLRFIRRSVSREISVSLHLSEAHDTNKTISAGLIINLNMGIYVYIPISRLMIS